MAKWLLPHRLAAILMATATIRAREWHSRPAATASFPSFTRIHLINTRPSGTSTLRPAPARWHWTPKHTAFTRRPRISNLLALRRRTIRDRGLHRSQDRL